VKDDYRVAGTSRSAPFRLTIHRGDGMALLAMDWKGGKRPPDDFVGFGIQYTEPGSTAAQDVPNRLSFEGTPEFGKRQSSMQAPIQKFRWVHFPANAHKPGPFAYEVTPVFMNDDGSLRYGPSQTASLELSRETVPGALNITFTRGFVASQAFVDRFLSKGPIETLLPQSADDPLTFTPTHPQAKQALKWMGFDARQAILDVLDAAIADRGAQVRVVAYDLNEPEVVTRLEKLKKRVRVIVDDSDDHGEADSPETAAAARLAASAGADNVIRQHMANLQHNKTIVVTGPSTNTVVCGSTNFSWRGFFVQNNNALVLTGVDATQAFADAFDRYWTLGPAAFGRSDSAGWIDLKLPRVDAKATFSPHSAQQSVLASVADDMANHTTSSLLYSLAFLYQTKGAVRDAVTALTADPKILVGGISDQAVGGINVQVPGGNPAPVHPEALTAHVPFPFSAEPTGGSGIRMHHKFVVIDFNKPTARVYVGSFNFSRPADNQNGENLLLIADRRVATSFAVEAVRLFDHYRFRVAQQDAAHAVKVLALRKPPAAGSGDKPWFDNDYTDANRALDRTLFAAAD
jgi:phosphatidylserine/phosphatidylglycerophosphate/cardiolipin synthase-like enzyme